MQSWACFSFAVNFNCLMGKISGVFAADTLDVLGRAVTGNVHLPQSTEDLLVQV